jgi:hypothetical protein
MSRKSTALTPPKPKPKSKTVRFTWRHVSCSVRHTPDYLSTGQSHLELRVVSPKGCPVPLTDTGYFSHFMPGELLEANGGPVAFLKAWLDRDAGSKKYKDAEYRWRQGDLFDAER